MGSLRLRLMPPYTLLVCLLWLGLAGKSMAQQPPAAPNQQAPAAPGAPARSTSVSYFPDFDLGEPTLRVAFPTIGTMSYRSHPFYQISGESTYNVSKGATLQVFSSTVPSTSRKQALGIQLWHMLPSTHVELAWKTGIFFPTGFSLSYHYTHGYEDTYRFIAQKEIPYTISPMTMDTYYHQAILRVFAFNPQEKGLNYFLGVGVGLLEAQLETTPVRQSTTYLIELRQYPIGTIITGMEVNGNTVGYRMEIVTVNAKEVQLAINPFPNRSEITKIDFTGSMLRIMMHYKF